MDGIKKLLPPKISQNGCGVLEAGRDVHWIHLEMILPGAHKRGRFETTRENDGKNLDRTCKAKTMFTWGFWLMQGMNTLFLFASIVFTSYLFDWLLSFETVVVFHQFCTCGALLSLSHQGVHGCPSWVVELMNLHFPWGTWRVNPRYKLFVFR